MLRVIKPMHRMLAIDDGVIGSKIGRTRGLHLWWAKIDGTNDTCHRGGLQIFKQGNQHVRLIVLL